MQVFDMKVNDEKLDLVSPFFSDIFKRNFAFVTRSSRFDKLKFVRNGFDIFTIFLNVSK